MAGNGFYAEGVYQPFSQESWDDLATADSAGYTGPNDWDTWTEWNLTPRYPLTFTTPIIDAGRIDTFLPLCNYGGTGNVTITVQSGNTVDSSGGAIDSPASVTINNGDDVSAIKARFFQYTFSTTFEDSAGGNDRPVITSIDTTLFGEKESATFESIDSSTLSGSTGQRTLVVDKPITVTTVTTMIHNPDTSPYFVDSGDSAGGIYVADDYVTAGVATRPVMYVDKTSTNPVLHIYDTNSADGATRVDVTFDAVVQGVPKATMSNGTITR